MSANKKREAMLVQEFVPEPDAFYLGINSLNIKSVEAAKKRKASVLPVAAKHICREIHAEVCRSGGRIDLSRTALNYTLIPGIMSEGAITTRASTVMEEHGIDRRRLRKDKLMGAELVFSLSPKFKYDLGIYFAEWPEWTMRHFPAPAQIIAAIVHLDEDAPHLHIILVPVVAHGRMSGHDVVSYKGLYAKRVNSFHDGVAQ